MFRSPLRRTLPLLALGAVAGTAGPARAADLTAWIDALRVRSDVPLFTLPPAAGPVIAVDEHRAIDSYTQIVTLRGDPGTVGENQIVVTVTRDALAPRITDDILSTEATDRLPPMRMGLGPADTRDPMGGFGSAVGRSGALTCFYGWQTADLADRWISGDQPSIFQERHALSLRVRLCRTDLGAADLVALMGGLRSTATGGDGPAAIADHPTEGADAMSAALDLHQIAPAAADLRAEPVALYRPLPTTRPEPVRAVVRRVRPKRARVAVAVRPVHHRRTPRSVDEVAARAMVVPPNAPKVPLPE